MTSCSSPPPRCQQQQLTHDGEQSAVSLSQSSMRLLQDVVLEYQTIMTQEYLLICLLVVTFVADGVVSGSVGCYEDSKERIWPHGRNVLHMNSPALCKKLCAGHLYAGLQHRTECHCGDVMPHKALPPARCGTKCPGDVASTCGGNWAMEVYNVPPSSQGQFSGTHLGCFQDNPKRVWPNGLHRLDNNSPELCRNLCQGHGFIGLQSRFWCMCGDATPFIKLAPGACPGNCPGVQGVKCGGNWTLDVYDISGVTQQSQYEYTDVSAPQHDGGAHHVGCFEDNKDRVWKNGYNTLKENSPEQCSQLCAGFKYAGLQYGSQCHCGDYLPPRRLPQERCSTPCPGQYGTTCGGNYVMEVYTAAPAKIPEVVISTEASYLGCFSQTTDHRIWNNGANQINRQTPTLCRNLCAGFKYAGVQARNQCYCGDFIPPTLVHPSNCNATCAGDRKLFCGGQFAMQVFGVPTKIKQDASEETLIGCFEDTKERVWKNGLSRLEFNSHQLCKNLCVGYRYFGLESRLWCLCGDSIPPTAIDPALCRANCPGNPREKCGGPWALQVYEVAQSSFKPPAIDERVCGRRKVQHTGQQLIAGGSTAMHEDFPWHVGIYQKEASSSGFVQICGGTLISSSLVISAAHCFWDTLGKKKKDAALYKIAAGKLTRDWHTEDAGNQRRDVADVFVHEQYLGFERQLAHDISVLKATTPFLITVTVNVVCVDWKNLIEKQQLHSGSLGTIAGWGITEADKVSDTLKYVRLPYVPLIQCLTLVDSEFKAYLTEDKLCAGYVNKSIAVCSGDSGSGLVFPQREQDGERYYLRGVASVGHIPSASSISKCNNQQIAGFTLVSVYRDWIEQFVIFGNRR